MLRPIQINAGGKMRLAVIGIPLAVLLAACGGGGSSTPAAGGGGFITGIGGGGGPQVVTTTETGTKLTFVGTCTSVQGGAQGYEIGLCYTGGAASITAEALFQDRAVAVTQNAESPLAFNVTLPADWSGPVNLLDGEILAGKQTTQGRTTQLVDLFGVGIQRCLPSLDLCTVTSSTQAPTAQSSAFDMSYGLPGLTSRSMSYGIWAHTPKVSSDYYYGGFSTAATGQAKTPSGILTGANFIGTGALSFKGNAGAWIMSQQTTIVSGGNAAGRIAADVNVSFDKATGTVTGTLSNLRRTDVDSTGKAILVLESIASMTFSAIVNRADGTFVGAVSGTNKLRVKGALYGPNGDQISGQIAGTASDNRVMTGAFGAKI